MHEKTITGYLVVDWKNETHRTRKSKPSATELGANELLAELHVDVTIPEVEVPTLGVEIDVPEPQVYAAELDALDETDLPDWTDAAVEAIDEAAPRFEAAGSREEWRDAVDAVAMGVLTTVASRPDPEHVREFIDQAAQERIGAPAGVEP